MKTKQIVNMSLLAGMVVLSLVLGVIVSPSANADPAVTKVKCADGKRVEAKPGMKPDKSVLDDKDFKYACRNNGGYKVVDETISCKDGTNQNVYKSAADPKDKLDNKDRNKACKDHGGVENNDNDNRGGDSSGDLGNPIEGNDCAGVATAIIKCDPDSSGGTKTNGVWQLLLMVVNILTAGVGIIAVAGIVYGAVLYTTAEDKADQVKQATNIITNVVIGLVLFALMWAGLNFIVPGGVFSE